MMVLPACNRSSEHSQGILLGFWYICCDGRDPAVRLEGLARIQGGGTKYVKTRGGGTVHSAVDESHRTSAACFESTEH